MGVNGKCEDCILGHQTCCPFNGETEKDLAPLDLVAFDLWGLSCVQSAGGKVYLMIIVDAGTSFKYDVYLLDKSDSTTLLTFEIFCTKAETATGRKVHQLRTDRAYKSSAWGEYCQQHGITHKFTAPYSSPQNGLAECVIRTTIDNVCTLLRDSNLGHSYWAEVAAYSIDTRNLVPSHHHPGCIPTKSFSGKQQSVAHLHVFGAKCWVKMPAAHGASKLDPQSTECHFLGYVSRSGNYKVQDIVSCRVFVSCDVIFEGQPCHTLVSVGEEQIPLFDISTDKVPAPPANVEQVLAINDHHIPVQTTDVD